MNIDPVEEFQDLNYWIIPMIGKAYTPKYFSQKLRSQLNRNHPVRLKLIDGRDHELDQGDFSIGAEYDPELDQYNKKQLIFTLIINQRKNVPWLITQDLADRFVLELVEVLVHEYQHQQQYRSRRYNQHKERFVSEHKDIKIRLDQEYLGNPDEIDAYAANIAARFYLLSKIAGSVEVNINEEQSLDLRQYIKVFGRKHSVVKTLFNKINEHLTYLKDVENGKIRKRKSCRRPNLDKRGR